MGSVTLADVFHRLSFRRDVSPEGVEIVTLFDGKEIASVPKAKPKPKPRPKPKPGY